jgi:hypothetical protein
MVGFRLATAVILGDHHTDLVSGADNPVLAEQGNVLVSVVLSSRGGLTDAHASESVRLLTLVDLWVAEYYVPK